MRSDPPARTSHRLQPNTKAALRNVQAKAPTILIGLPQPPQDHPLTAAPPRVKASNTAFKQ